MFWMANHYQELLCLFCCACKKNQNVFMCCVYSCFLRLRHWHTITTIPPPPQKKKKKKKKNTWSIWEKSVIIFPHSWDSALSKSNLGNPKQGHSSRSHNGSRILSTHVTQMAQHSLDALFCYTWVGPTIREIKPVECVTSKKKSRFKKKTKKRQNNFEQNY